MTARSAEELIGLQPAMSWMSRKSVWQCEENNTCMNESGALEISEVLLCPQSAICGSIYRVGMKGAVSALDSPALNYNWKSHCANRLNENNQHKQSQSGDYVIIVRDQV